MSQARRSHRRELPAAGTGGAAKAGGAGEKRFKGVLTDFPAQRDRWFAFRTERLRQAAREWLEENGVEASGLLN